MRLSLAQMYCEWGNVKGNLKKSEEYIRKSRSQTADMVVFPETSVHGMWKDHLVRLAAEPLDGPIVKQMARWARKYRIAIGFGMAERTRQKPFNSYILLNKNGILAGVYRKNYVTRLEQAFYRKDSRRPTFKIGALRVAVAICCDSCQDELLRSYGRRGVDLVIMPHAWDADPILKNNKTISFPNMDKLVETYGRGLVVGYRTHNEMMRKFVNRVTPVCKREKFYAAFVSQTGQIHPLISCVGPSFVVDREGKILTYTKSKKESLLLVDIA